MSPIFPSIGKEGKRLSALVVSLIAKSTEPNVARSSINISLKNNKLKNN